MLANGLGWERHIEGLKAELAAQRREQEGRSQRLRDLDGDVRRTTEECRRRLMEPDLSRRLQDEQFDYLDRHLQWTEGRGMCALRCIACAPVSSCVCTPHSCWSDCLWKHLCGLQNCVPSQYHFIAI